MCHNYMTDGSHQLDQEKCKGWRYFLLGCLKTEVNLVDTKVSQNKEQLKTLIVIFELCHRTFS